MKNYLKKILLLALCLALSGGCASFQHLTTYHEDKQEGPQAADCGSCHVLQFEEWSDSAHAHAYQNVSFQEAFHGGGGEECLGCHASLEIRQGNTEARSFNRDEGVTCISCHLSQGRMHGPHKSSALLHPHPVQDEDGFYLSVEICAACHGETYEEYQAIAERKEVPTCLACHAAPRRRTASQGTNFFSNAVILPGYGNSLFGVTFPVFGEKGEDDVFVVGDDSLWLQLAPMAATSHEVQDLRNVVAPGERGRVILHRLDPTFLIINLPERDTAVAKAMTSGEMGLVDIAPLEFATPQNRQGVY